MSINCTRHQLKDAPYLGVSHLNWAQDSCKGIWPIYVRRYWRIGIL